MKIVSNYRTFRSRYVVQKRRPEEYFFNKYYAHLIDPFFTKLVYDLRLKPNTVTIISGLLGVGSGISMMFQQLILAGILLQLHHIIDGADGNLARLTNQCTVFGAKLDAYTDRLVRAVVLIGIILATNEPMWIDGLLILTFIIDHLAVQIYILPFIRKYGVIRSKWKQWFLTRGVIPSFDIFTIYFLISLFAIMNELDILIYLLIILKNLDWIYRVWECVKTSIIYRGKKL
ncbi:CDP-alcohol phosphatidyltransferase [Niallia circulans]|uniref:CDP-alcohol phosphatidyltransferase family protein n=1 Tax=Niallia circulans TaxID=1397 RepID=UPI000F447B60|nr:CDP-alcohol phosphatidyltransferase family protein [Niallia circulans]AYV67880.1 CDP-alcohol phosphatidyltransferase [Niallia circulans]